MRLFGTLLIEITVLWLFMSEENVDGKRILIMTPAPAYSHQIVHRALGVALHKRGHEVVIATANPLKDPTLTNYTEIDFSSSYRILKGPTLATRYRSTEKYTANRLLRRFMCNMTQDIFTHPEVRKLYAPDSNEKFDAVIVEAVIGPAAYAFAYRFQASLIGLSTLDLHMYHHYVLSQPLLTSHLSNWEHFETMGVDVPFWRRVYNFLRYLYDIYEWNTEFVPLQDSALKKFMGSKMPDINEYEKNMSLMLVNHDVAISYARPLQPNVICFSGIHVEETPPALPKRMREFLDSAKEGFIYMSLGSNMKSTELSSEKFESMLEAFSKLSCKVLWKYEENDFPGKSSNILTAKWIPQQGVLAHPNIRLFIYQGGLQSTEEAIHYAVPVVGIPLMFDQGYRIIKLKSLGVGKHLDLNDITERTFYDTIQDVLQNSSYKEKMVELRTLIKDKPISSIENVIWWIEHAIRHKGAPHLRFNGLHHPWYQKYDTDIIAFCTVVLLIALALHVLALFKGLLLISKYFRKPLLCRPKCSSVSENSHKKDL